MTEQTISLLTVYQGWDTYQELFIKAIEMLSLVQNLDERKTEWEPLSVKPNYLLN